MFSFYEKEILQIRERYCSDPGYAQYLADTTRNIRTKLYIQKTGAANWTHYYTCPRHSVPLTFDHFDPIHHVCPIDGEVFTGEPYDSAWWGHILLEQAPGCYLLAVAYLAGADENYLQCAKEILLGYARYYPSYEVHGDIPYNHPGKASAQVLDDANFINYLASAYDLIRDCFTPQEQELIHQNLFREGVRHLMTYFTPQLHNHEVAICSAIGIVGILLEDASMIQFAVNGTYGLKYQLDHGVLSDGLWFEVSLSYHLYVLRWLFRYEKIARHTSYSLLEDEHYREILYRMIIYLNHVLMADDSFPRLNDGSCTIRHTEYLLEYAYSYFKTPEILKLLQRALAGTWRHTEESLLYGSRLPRTEDTLPDVSQTSFYLAGHGSQLAIIRGNKDQTLLLKAAPYGGEHDHYDRMGLSYSAFGRNVCTDLGTASGYGAPLHYSYFKNTGSHNTVCINGDNMPPAVTRVNAYNLTACDDIYLDVETDWRCSYPMPDSFVIRQWVEDSYRDTYMRRIIQWYDSYFIDVFVTESPNHLTKDYTLHIDGHLTTVQTPEKETPASAGHLLHKHGPQKHLHHAWNQHADGMVKNTWQCSGFELDIYTRADSCRLIHALGPSNPSTGDLSYYILRSTAQKAVYVNVIEAHKTGEALIRNVEISVQNETVTVCITESAKERRFELVL